VGAFTATPFEEGMARERVAADDVLDLIAYPAYFRLTKQRLPDGRDGVLARLADEGLLVSRGPGRYDVTCLGAILFARDLNSFGRLRRKALRIVKYRGNSKVATEREWSDPAGRAGYAGGFEAAMAF